MTGFFQGNTLFSLFFAIGACDVVSSQKQVQVIKWGDINNETEHQRLTSTIRVLPNNIGMEFETIDERL